MAQLHLAFASPVSPIEGKNEGKLSDQLGKFNQLAVLIGKLDVREFFSNDLVHVLDLSINLKAISPDNL
jgi:hypothetical protein